MFIKDTVIQKINEYINQETDECIEYPDYFTIEDT